MLRYCQLTESAAKHALYLISAHSNVSLTAVMTVRRANFFNKYCTSTLSCDCLLNFRSGASPILEKHQLVSCNL